MDKGPFRLKVLRWQLVAGLALLLVALGYLGSIPEGQAGVCPPVQNTLNYTYLYGEVKINLTPAAPGVVVMARNPRGHTVGCQVVQSAGEYPVMYVYGEQTVGGTPIPGMKSGETILLLAGGAGATPAPVATWANDKTGHWVDVSGVITAVPTPVAVALPVISQGQLVLTWLDVGGLADHYEVWRSSTTPYFAPGSAGAGKFIVQPPSVAGSPVNFIDPASHLGNPLINDFYIIVAVNAAGQAAAASSPVGKFDFGLQAGTP